MEYLYDEKKKKNIQKNHQSQNYEKRNSPILKLLIINYQIIKNLQENIDII